MQHLIMVSSIFSIALFDRKYKEYYYGAVAQDYSENSLENKDD